MKMKEKLDDRGLLPIKTVGGAYNGHRSIINFDASVTINAISITRRDEASNGISTTKCRASSRNTRRTTPNSWSYN